jgi:protein-arginine kinase activator protein McsA
MGIRQCDTERGCGKTKSVSEFGKNTRYSDDMFYLCKECVNARNHKYRKEHLRMFKIVTKLMRYVVCFVIVVIWR